MFQISILAYIITIIVSFVGGVVAVYFYNRRDLTAKKQKIEHLNQEIENHNKEFTELTKQVNDNADVVFKQKTTIETAKRKAEAVKDETKNDTIDDLIDFFNTGNSDS